MGGQPLAACRRHPQVRFSRRLPAAFGPLGRISGPQLAANSAGRPPQTGARAWPSLIQPSLPVGVAHRADSGRTGHVPGRRTDRPPGRSLADRRSPARWLLRQAGAGAGVGPGRSVREALAGQPVRLASATITSVLSSLVWTVAFHPAAEKELGGLSAVDRVAVLRAVEKLAAIGPALSLVRDRGRPFHRRLRRGPRDAGIKRPEDPLPCAAYGVPEVHAVHAIASHSLDGGWASLVVAGGMRRASGQDLPAWLLTNHFDLKKSAR